MRLQVTAHSDFASQSALSGSADMTFRLIFARFPNHSLSMEIL